MDDGKGETRTAVRRVSRKMELVVLVAIMSAGDYRQIVSVNQSWSDDGRRWRRSGDGKRGAGKWGG